MRNKNVKKDSIVTNVLDLRAPKNDVMINLLFLFMINPVG